MAGNERRRHPRTPLTVDCRIEGLSERTSARMSDLSLAGCFVDTITPLPVGARITIYATHGDGEVALTGRVTRLQRTRGFGFALEFVDLSDEARDIIQSLVQRSRT